jgi:hypothetical protein
MQNSRDVVLSLRNPFQYELAPIFGVRAIDVSNAQRENFDAMPRDLGGAVEWAQSRGWTIDQAAVERLAMELRFSPEKAAHVDQARADKVTEMKARRAAAANAFDDECQRLLALPTRQIMDEIAKISMACVVAAVFPPANELTVGVSGTNVGAGALFGWFSNVVRGVGRGWMKSDDVLYPMNISDRNLNHSLGSKNCSRRLDKLAARAQLHAQVLERRMAAGVVLVLEPDYGGFVVSKHADVLGPGIVRQVFEARAQMRAALRSSPALPALPADDPKDISAAIACSHDWLPGGNRRYEWCRRCGEKRTLQAV